MKASRTDLAPVVPALTSPSDLPVKEGQRRPAPSFSLVRRGHRPAYAAFAGEGPHALEITTLEGKCVLRAHGTGPKAYSLAHLEARTVYAISGHSPTGAFSCRFLVP